MSFDITSATKQMKEIETEIRRLNGLLRNTRLAKSKIENDIRQYLEHSHHQGVIVNNVTILKEEKLVHRRLKKQEKEDLIEKIKNVSKGDQILKSSISIQYDKLK
jgi:hypothetical protein